MMKRLSLLLFAALIFTLAASGCSSSSKADSHPPYSIAELKSLPGSKAVVSVVVQSDTTVSEPQLSSIAKEAVDKALDDDSRYKEITIFFNDYPEFVGKGAALGIITYTKDDRKYDANIPSKDWSKRLTPEEVKTWASFASFSSTQLGKDPAEIKRQFCETKQLSIETLNALVLKQVAWMNQRFKTR